MEITNNGKRYLIYSPKASKNIDQGQRSKYIFKFNRTFEFVFKIFPFAKYYISTQHILKYITLRSMYNVCEGRQMYSHDPCFPVGNIDNKRRK